MLYYKGTLKIVCSDCGRAAVITEDLYEYMTMVEAQKLATIFGWVFLEHGSYILCPRCDESSDGE